MSVKTNSKKRIIYLSLLAVSLIAIAVIVAVSLSRGNNAPDNNDLNAQKPSVSVSTPSSSSGNGDIKPEPDVKPNDKPNDTPVVEVVSFLLPVKGGVCIKSYTDATVVYNSTLGVYTGHKAMDFSGEEGAKVVAVYGGTVKEITTGYLQGTTVTIDHGKGLLTVYNSIEPIETLKVGDKVTKGQEIGVISTNNKQEYKDGPHLHFEVIENGVNITPLKYLEIEEK